MVDVAREAGLVYEVLLLHGEGLIGVLAGGEVGGQGVELAGADEDLLADGVDGGLGAPDGGAGEGGAGRDHVGRPEEGEAAVAEGDGVHGAVVGELVAGVEGGGCGFGGRHADEEAALVEGRGLREHGERVRAQLEGVDGSAGALVEGDEERVREGADEEHVAVGYGRRARGQGSAGP